MERGKKETAASDRSSTHASYPVPCVYFKAERQSSNGGDIRQGTSVMSGVLAVCLSKASGMKEVLFTTVGNFSLSQRGKEKGLFEEAGSEHSNVTSQKPVALGQLPSSPELL